VHVVGFYYMNYGTLFKSSDSETLVLAHSLPPSHALMYVCVCV